jgi:invasion protein IalB
MDRSVLVDDIEALLEETTALVEQLEADGEKRTRFALQVAVEGFDEALLRLGRESFSGHADDPD